MRLFARQSQSRCGHRLAAGSILAALLLVAGCDQLGLSTPAERIATARKNLAAKDPKSAEIQLKTALQKEPKNIAARLLLADVYLAMHRGQDAEVELGQAEQFGASSTTTLLPRARAYLIQRNFPRVVKEVPAVVTGDANRQADLLEVRGEALSALGQQKEAEAAYDSALKIRPGSVKAMDGKAQALAYQGRNDEALALADAALAIAPNDGRTLLLKGDIVRASGRQDEALELYRSAAQQSPDDEQVLVTFASTLLAAKQLDAAREQIATIQRKFPKAPRGQFLLAILKYDERDFKAASESVQKVLSADPNYAPAIALSAATQYALGSYVAAEANAQRFVGLVPNSLYGRELLATILLRQKKHARAFEVIKPVLAVPDLKDPRVFAIAGSALLGSGDLVRGNEFLARATQLDPANSSIRRAYGVASLAGGEVDRAIGEFGAVVQALPADSDANTMLILSYIDKKDYDHAIAVGKQLVADNPKNADFHNLLGGAYAAKGDKADARTAFETAVKLQPLDAPPAINLAKLELDDGHPDEARKWLTALVDRDRKNLDALTMLAEIEQMTGHREAMRPWLEAAARENPDDLGPQIRFVQYLIDVGDLQRAVAIAHDVVNRRGDDVDALSLLGKAQVAAGQRDAAIATYGRLVGLRPAAPSFQVAIARLEAADGKVAAAQTALGRALAIDPEYLDAQISLAELDTKLGKFADASRIVSQLEKRPGQTVTARLMAGDVAMGQRRYDVASKAYLDAWNASKIPMTAIKLHAAVSRSGRRKEADERISAWMVANPTDVDSRIYLASLAIRDGNAALATRLYREVLAAQPANPVALNELALLLQAAHDPSALDYAERAYAAQPANPSVGDTLGWMLVEGDGNVPRGRQLLEKAVQTAPSNVDARFHYAVALMKSGDRTAARNNLAQVLASADGARFQEQARQYMPAPSSR